MVKNADRQAVGMSERTKERHEDVKGRCEAARLERQIPMLPYHVGTALSAFRANVHVELPDAIDEIERLHGVVMRVVFYAEKVPGFEREVERLQKILNGNKRSAEIKRLR